MRSLHELAADKSQIYPSLGDLLARAVADKLKRDPSLVSVGVANIDRWLANGVVSNPRWFLRWRELIEHAQVEETAFCKVLEILRADTEEARRWRDFSPFAGVLTSAERRVILRQCSYSH